MSTTKFNPPPTKTGRPGLASTDVVGVGETFSLEAARCRATGAPGPIEGYEIGEVLGHGGTATVYRARRMDDGVVVALKIVTPRSPASERSRRLLLREIESMTSLVHPNIVPIYQGGLSGDGIFLAMELCAAGSTVSMMRRRGGTLPIVEAGAILLDALAGLGYMHAQGYVHRDVKPENIILTGEGGTAKVSDFGLAKSFEEAGFSGLTTNGTSMGTPNFMAPEQFTNYRFVDPVTDIWAAGATFYHLITGHFPRDLPAGTGSVEALLNSRIVPILERDRSVPRKLAATIMRALGEEIDERFGSAEEFRSELRRALR